MSKGLIGELLLKSLEEVGFFELGFEEEIVTDVWNYVLYIDGGNVWYKSIEVRNE